MFRNARILIRDSSDVGGPVHIFPTVRASSRLIRVTLLSRSGRPVNGIHVIVAVLYQIRVGCVCQPLGASAGGSMGGAKVVGLPSIRVSASRIGVPAAHCSQ